MTNAIAIAAWALSAILVSELFGYPLHRLLHSGFIHFLSKNHMQHHLLLYGPLQKQRPREEHLDATTGQVALGNIAAHAPEIMTEVLARDDAARARILERKNVVAIGPGLGQDPETVQFVRLMVEQTPLPMVVDADGLNALAGHPARYRWPVCA